MPANAGKAYAYSTLDQSGSRYDIAFIHLQPLSSPPTGTRSGQQLGILYDWGAKTHLHIEIQINGIYVKPENYFCN